MPRLADFAGTWRLRRAIRHADGAVARLVGSATWRAEDEGFVCEEDGRLRLPGGGGLPARRTTLWRAGADGIAVSFADGRPFHRIGPDGTARHDCPPDTYRLAYDFADWPRWSVVWRVTGPRKDYIARTRFGR